MCLVLVYAHEHMPAEDPLELELQILTHGM